MRIHILAALALLPMFASAQEKWWVTTSDGSLYAVGRTRSEAVSRAESRAKLEGKEKDVLVASRRDTLPTVADRMAEETATEVLLRLEQLRELGTRSHERSWLGVRDEAQMAINRSLVTGKQLAALNQGLELTLVEVALNDLEANSDPKPDVRLLAEPYVLSWIDKVPAGFRQGYLSLLERLDGYRPASVVTTNASRNRDALIKRSLVPQGENRLVVEGASTKDGLVSITYRFVSRSESDRNEILVSDTWKSHKGAYLLLGTKSAPVEPPDFSAAAQKIVQQAKAELSRIQERQAQREREERAANEERKRLVEEQKRLEQEKRDQEERDRQEIEKRRVQREEYVRQFNGFQDELDQVTRERDNALRSLPDAQRDLEKRAEEVRETKEAKDVIVRRIKELRENIEQAKKEGKDTSLMESVMREARQQYDDKDRHYEAAVRRADSARSLVDSLLRLSRDRDERRGQIESELRRLKGLIDALGG